MQYKPKEATPEESNAVGRYGHSLLPSLVPYGSGNNDFLYIHLFLALSLCPYPQSLDMVIYSYGLVREEFSLHSLSLSISLSLSLKLFSRLGSTDSAPKIPNVVYKPDKNSAYAQLINRIKAIAPAPSSRYILIKFIRN